jgi:hypothetical protein
MNLFRTWDDLIKEFTNVARKVMHKGGEKFVPIKVVAAHVKLQEHVRYVTLGESEKMARSNPHFVDLSIHFATFLHRRGLHDVNISHFNAISCLYVDVFFSL